MNSRYYAYTIKIIVCILNLVWTSPSHFQLWYLLSKTLAEEAAWKFAEGNGIDLVSINPGFVIGPILQPAINLTVEMIQNLITGEN